MMPLGILIEEETAH